MCSVCLGCRFGGIRRLKRENPSKEKRRYSNGWDTFCHALFNADSPKRTFKYPLYHHDSQNNL
ncbi:hypothetical protein HMPREF9371_1807 [Neisseria shayeganii 871]|uniref:Uncharacterized protein n=1 Tax=Neisseria shayeganii 871 TaxID=1032488 RepID=G4CJL7_9NEIS|nr:hypothetical protein HMPREF9371_1807 [Neisseria shayeganii 871]